MVPREPTGQMHVAGMNAHFDAENESKEFGAMAWRSNRAAHIYRAMIAAAPPVRDDVVEALGKINSRHCTNPTAGGSACNCCTAHWVAIDSAGRTK